jgi:hypothetical protein
MNKKVKDLVNIMLMDESNHIKTKAAQMYSLILKKSYNLIEAIFTMDKLGWFTHLKIKVPSSSQL